MEKKQSKIIKSKTSSKEGNSSPKKAPSSLALPQDKRIITSEGLKRRQPKDK